VTRARLAVFARGSCSRLAHASRLLGRDERSGRELHLEGRVSQRPASDAARNRPVQYGLERPHVRHAVSDVLRMCRATGEVHDRRHRRRHRHEGSHPGELCLPDRGLPRLQLDSVLWRDGHGVLHGWHSVHGRVLRPEHAAVRRLPSALRDTGPAVQRFSFFLRRVWLARATLLRWRLRSRLLHRSRQRCRSRRRRWSVHCRWRFMRCVRRNLGHLPVHGAERFLRRVRAHLESLLQRRGLPEPADVYGQYLPVATASE